MSRSWLSVPTCLLLSSLAAAGTPPSKEPLSERDQAAADAAGAVAFTLPADAPRPPSTTDRIKKTQPTELSTLPAGKSIKAFEDLVYTMQKPESSVWSYLSVGEGGRVAPPSSMVLDQVATLRTHLAAVKSADPGWRRIAEYEQHLAFFEHVVASHQAYSEGHAAAKQAAAADAAAAHDAAWAAKRSADEGILHDLHRASVGKVVFATRAIAATDGSVEPAAKVAADAPLFARAYLAESGWNAMNSAGVDCGASASPAFRYNAFVTVGNAKFELVKRGVDKAAFQGPTTLDLSPDGSLTGGGTFARDDEKKPGFKWIASVVPVLADGANTVGWEVRAWCNGAKDSEGVVVATGSLVVEADAGKREAVAKRGAYTMAPSVHPASALATERAKLESYFAGKGESLLDLRTSSDWQPVRHPATGQITHRAAEAVALVREKGGTECNLVSLVLEEPYDGSRYGPTLNLGMVVPRPFVCQAR